MNIYRSFEQWKNGGFLEHGAPRTEEYTEEELHLVEMGWNYGYDAGRAVEQALDKMAENARELGLSYDDEPKIGCVNHDCDKCKAQQAPLTCKHEWFRTGAMEPGECRCIKCGVWNTTTPPAPQPVPVKTYHDGKPWPVQPKPWVALTEKEFINLYEDACNFGTGSLIRHIEAKLKEKNA